MRKLVASAGVIIEELVARTRDRKEFSFAWSRWSLSRLLWNILSAIAEHTRRCHPSRLSDETKPNSPVKSRSLDSATDRRVSKSRCQNKAISRKAPPTRNEPRAIRDPSLRSGRPLGHPSRSTTKRSQMIEENREVSPGTTLQDPQNKPTASIASNGPEALRRTHDEPRWQSSRARVRIARDEKA